MTSARSPIARIVVLTAACAVIAAAEWQLEPSPWGLIYATLYLALGSQTALLGWACVLLVRAVLMFTMAGSPLDEVLVTHFPLIRMGYVAVLLQHDKLFARHRFARWLYQGVESSGTLIKGALILAVIGILAFPIVFVVPHLSHVLVLGALVLYFGIRCPRSTKTRDVSWKERVAEGALLVVSVALCVVGIEIAFRILAPPPAVEVEGTVWKPHHRALFTTIENASQELKTEEYEFSYQLSDQGLRERHISPKPENAFRIVSIGDSMTMGLGVSQEEAYPQALNATFDEPVNGKQVEVINAGMTGYGPWQEIIHFKERCLPFEPDMVLFQVFPENDIRDTLAREQIMLRAFDNHYQRLMEMWRNQKDSVAVGELRQQSRAFDVLRQALLDALTLRQAFRKRLGREKPPPQKFPETANRPWWLETFYTDYYEELEYGWEQLEASIVEMAELCERRNIELVVLYLPGSMVIYPQFYEYVYDEFDVEPGDYDFNLSRRRLGKICERHGLTFVDVTPHVLEAAQTSDALLYFKKDGHPTAAGHRVIADYLHGVLKSMIAKATQAGTGS